MFPGITHTYYCWICGNAVDLQTCKTDEYGMAVHENCYVAKLALSSETNRLSNRPSRSSSHQPFVLPSPEKRISKRMSVPVAIAAIALIASVASLVPLFRERTRLQAEIANLESQLPVPADTARKVHAIELSDIQGLSSQAGRRAELLPAVYNLQQQDVAWKVGGTYPKQGFDS